MVTSYHESMEIPDDLEAHSLSNSCALQLIIDEKGKEEIQSLLNVVSVYDQVSPEVMAEQQCKDPTLGIVYQNVRAMKFITSATSKIMSKAVRKYSPHT